jgi:hypothetical protein
MELSAKHVAYRGRAVYNVLRSWDCMAAGKRPYGCLHRKLQANLNFVYISLMDLLLHIKLKLTCTDIFITSKNVHST